MDKEPPSKTYLEHQQLLKDANSWRRLKKTRMLNNKMLHPSQPTTRIHKYIVNEEHPTGMEIKLSRPRSLVPDEETLVRINDMAMLQATQLEMAAVFGVKPSTWFAFVDEFPEVKKTIEQAESEGKLSLRRSMFKAASEGNATMLKHLAQHHLGQHDKSISEVKHTIFQQLVEVQSQTIDASLIQSLDDHDVFMIEQDDDDDDDDD